MPPTPSDYWSPETFRTVVTAVCTLFGALAGVVVAQRNARKIAREGIRDRQRADMLIVLARLGTQARAVIEAHELLLPVYAMMTKQDMLAWADTDSAKKQRDDRHVVEDCLSSLRLSVADATVLGALEEFTSVWRDLGKNGLHAVWEKAQKNPDEPFEGLAEGRGALMLVRGKLDALEAAARPVLAVQLVAPCPWWRRLSRRPSR